GAAALVVDRAAAVLVEGDDDARAVSRQGLVDGVVDHLVDQVVEAGRAGRADVHARTPPNVLPALEDLDLLCGVRHIRAKGFGPAGRFRQGFSDCHLSGNQASQRGEVVGNNGGESQALNFTGFRIRKWPPGSSLQAIFELVSTAKPGPRSGRSDKR